MAQAKKILLVEGEADKFFFEEICKKLSLETSVLVAPPKDLGGTHNTKGGVMNYLKILLPQLEDGQITQIAAVVDSDYVKHGGGYQKTLETLSKVVKPFGFFLEEQVSSHRGLFFRHSDGLPDFGSWIMPDNQREGMLEDWIKSCLKDDEQALFQQASQAVQNIEKPKFKSHLRSKAEVATWLAWQKKPGHGLYGVLMDELLNENNALFKAIEEWLLQIFNQEINEDR
jgi:hypothetical protein